MPITDADSLWSAYTSSGPTTSELKPFVEANLRSARTLTSYAVWAKLGEGQKGWALLSGTQANGWADALKKKKGVLVAKGKYIFKDGALNMSVEPSSAAENLRKGLQLLFKQLSLTHSVTLVDSSGKLGAPKEDDEEWTERQDQWEDLTKFLRDRSRLAPKASIEGWESLKDQADDLRKLIESKNPRLLKEFDTKLQTLREVANDLNIDDFEQRKKEKTWETPKAAPPAPEREGAVLVAQEDRIYVFLDSHQNKHQAPGTMIGQLGTWKSKKGSTFAEGKGLQWHRDNTAQAMLKWADGLKLQPGEEQVASKTTPIDGIIYDAHAYNDGYYVIVEYHCNPPESE